MELTLIIGGNAALAAAKQAVRDANNEFERAIAMGKLAEVHAAAKPAAATPEQKADDETK